MILNLNLSNNNNYKHKDSQFSYNKSIYPIIINSNISKFNKTNKRSATKNIKSLNTDNRQRNIYILHNNKIINSLMLIIKIKNINISNKVKIRNKSKKPINNNKNLFLIRIG